MANKQNELKLGSDSFKEMAALALDGWLASCESCVEFYYFQSHQNARIFLESCAEAGLVENVSLLALKEAAESNPETAQEWYDQAIYISAPAFRKLNLDLARQKIENTANAVYNAFFIYHELLGADKDAINAAYAKAIDERKLRNSEIAEQRLDVDLSAVAKMRLILDGFRSSLVAKNKRLPAAEQKSVGEIERCATDDTVEYVLVAGSERYPSTREIGTSDRSEELEQFIIDFVIDPSELKQFSRDKNRDLPEGFHIQLLSLISELCRRRYECLKSERARALQFLARVKEAILEAQVNWANDIDYVAALTDLSEDLNPEQIPALGFSKATWLQSAFQPINL